MRVSAAGQSVENKLLEDERLENRWMAHNMKSIVSKLGTVKISTAGMQTLTFEVTSDFVESKPKKEPEQQRREIARLCWDALKA